MFLPFTLVLSKLEQRPSGAFKQQAWPEFKLAKLSSILGSIKVEL